MNETTTEAEDAPIATATRVPPEASESDDEPDSRPVLAATRAA